MADIHYGSGGGDWRDAIRRMQEQGRANDEMTRKEEERRQTEERSQPREKESVGTRQNLSQATAELTNRLEANAAAFRAETAALETNLAMMERSLALRRELAQTTLTGGAVASTPVAATGTAGDAELTRLRARNEADARARAEADAAAVAQADAALRARRPLALPRASYIEAGPVGSTGTGGIAEATGLGGGPRYLPPEARQVPPTFGYLTGGPAERAHSLPGMVADPTEAEHLKDLRAQSVSVTESMAGLESEQVRVNQSMAEANALYADASTRLTRHGALTTEFIQSLARGQVTLGEFGSQMTSVIGKFGGWLIAGAAVYGVYDVFKHLTEGATESQAAIQNLGRFLPGLGGPAGGGSNQVSAAYSAISGLSSQFNLPVSQVADPAQIMARLFGSGPNPLGNTVAATQAVLAASRLDQVPTDEATRYLTGIGQSFGFLGTANAGQRIVGVVNSLNALQSQFGARVAETLPAVARAAPAALAGGLPSDQLEALAALGVRAGLPGPQVGTALLRSIGTFAWRPRSQQTFREYGINPQLGDYGGLVSQVFGTIDRRAQGPNPLSGVDLRNLAIGLGGPLLGTRSILPLLAAEQLHPGTYDRALGIARNPRPYQEDLGALLGSVSERFKAIGIGLENFGSKLAQAGLLTPITAMLNAVNLVTHALEALLSPVASMVGVFNELPGPVRDLLGLFVAFRAARFLLNTQFGSGAQSLFGRLPGLETLRNQPREAVEGIRATLQREALPADERRTEDASRRLREARIRETEAQAELGQYARNRPSEELPVNAPERVAFNQGYQDRQAALQRASAGATAAQDEYVKAAQQSAKTESLIALSKDGQYTWAERSAILEEEGYRAISETVDLTKELAVAYSRRVAEIRSGGGIAGAGPVPASRAGAAGAAGESVAVAGATAAVVGAAVTELANNSSAQQTLQRGLQSSGLIPTGTSAAETRARIVAINEADRAAAAGAGPGSRLTAPAFLGDIGDRVAQRLDPLVSRVRDAGGVLPLARQAGAGIIGGPGAPFAALLATQLVGGAIPGGVGSYITNVGGQAATGAIIAQMLGKGGPVGLGAGAALGTIAGSFSQGTGQGIASLVGGGIGAVLGSIVPGGSIPGALIGSTVGSLAAQIFGGGKQSEQDQQNAAHRQALAALRAAGVSGLPSVNLPFGGALNTPLNVAGSPGLGTFGNQVESNLATAFLGSGTTSQSAAANLKTQMDSLTGIIQLFGPTTKQGRTASSVLNDVVGAAVEGAQFDPQTALQLIGQATQTKSKPISDLFTYQLSQQSGVTGGDQGAALTAANAYQSQVVGPFYQEFLNTQEELTAAQGALTRAQKHGSQQTINAAKLGLQQAQTNYDAARGAYTLSQQAGTVAEQQFYQQQYQQSAQLIQSQTQLGQARAGGSQAGQLRAQLQGAQKTLDTLNSYGPGKLGPAQYETQRDQAEAQIRQVQTQLAQQGLSEVTARGAVAVSRTPLGDPIAQARAQYKSYLDQLHYMQQHKKDFDPAQINDMLAQVNEAWKNVAQQVQDYKTQMIGIRTQLQQAHDYGDAVAQASDAVRGALSQISVARTPQARAQAQANYAQAIAQQQQAQVARIQAEGQLQSAQAWGDPLAQSQALQRAAQAELSIAHGRDQVIAAETALAQAQQQGHQAVLQLIQAHGQLQQAMYSGDAVAQAGAAISTAQAELGAAHGQLEVLQAEAQLKSAQFQYNQALVQRKLAIGQLAASETVNPVQQLYRQLQATTQALGIAQGPDQRRQLQTQLNTLTHQWEQATIDQRSSIVDFQFQMMQITAQQAVRQLTSLTHLKGITLAQRQQLLEQIRRYQLGEINPIGSNGQFDLAPGNIRLPTYYDVGHAIRHTPAFVGGGGVSNANQINVYVGKDADIAKVADVLDRATGGNLRGRLRAAGVR